MSTAVLLWIAFQTGTTHTSSTQRVQRSQMDTAATVSPDSVELSRAEEAAYEEREFIQLLNGLSRALNAFAETYKGGQVDLKTVKAVQKAMHELEKTKWFRPQKTK